MSTNKTSNFGLNQWEPGDQVRREEFNADNQKIDTALGQMPYVKILEVVTQTQERQVDLDVSQIDFTQYWMVELFCDCATPSDRLALQVNGLNNDYGYGSASGSGSGIGTTSILAHLGGRVLFYMPSPQARVGCVYFAGTENSFTGLQGVAPCTWAQLATFHLSRNSGIPVGTRIALFGIKK